jgi:serine phosphatase RsbU (regulator of sigma subunit)/anti-sigma regulatory factor (Ser/Thr protein kinase)
MYLYESIFSDMDPLKKSWLSRVGLVFIAAVLVEIISIVQYEHVRKLMQEEMEIRSEVVMGAMMQRIEHLLELTEVTMKENLWDVQRCLNRPDSVFASMVRLIDDNPYVVGGCLAFVPHYYPSVGRLFEPYAVKEKGKITVQQIAGPNHDYTRNQEFAFVLDSLKPSWTDPYSYGPDSLNYATYSYPVRDYGGRLAAVCGLDIDLTWLGDTLNAHQPFPSSFSMLLTEEGSLVTGPSKRRISPELVSKTVDILNGTLPASAIPGLAIRKTKMDRDPYWQLVQVYKVDEAFTRMRRMRRQQMIFILLALAILAFMTNRYARSARKLREASEEQARLSGELSVARNIQQEMLPKTFPPFIYGSVESAREVGGDVFDYFIRDGKVFFCIGDVSGKGVPAAMLMSMIRSLFRMVAQKEDNPSHVLRILNEELCRGNDSNMFATFFVGSLDLYSGEMRFANAGHDKPFLVSDEIVLLQAKSNLPLGVFPDTHFEEQTLTFAPGTTLFMYTDGLTEAKNIERKAFGRDAVLEVLRGCTTGASPQDVVSSLSEAAHRFAGEAPQSDDLTMLVVRFDPGHILREQIELSNDLSEVARLSTFVKGFCAALKLEPKAASGLRLALEEVVVNVINYAFPEQENGSVSIQADSNYKEVRFTVTDAGIPFDPTSVLEADTTLDAENRPIGGLGVLLARKLMDSVSYSRSGGQNVLTLTKTIS